MLEVKIKNRIPPPSFRVLHTSFAVGFYITLHVDYITSSGNGPEQMVRLCLKVYTARRVALHSHRFYITLACECLLLMHTNLLPSWQEPLSAEKNAFSITVLVTCAVKYVRIMGKLLKIIAKISGNLGIE